MKTQRLQTRFFLAGCLLVAATIGSSIWSGLTFFRLNTVVDATLRESQETIDLSTELHSSLEREDDALLLFLSGDVEQARRDLDAERHRGDAGYERLLGRLRDRDEQEKQVAATLRKQIDHYRAAGDDLLSRDSRMDGLEQYHRQVNPLLRKAVAGCDTLREANFRSMQKAGIRARDEAERGMQLVAAISLLAVLLGIGVAVWLARSILVPVQELTESVEDIRQGHFDRRVLHTAADELGQLASGFNRMADALAQYRRSSLGELLAVKMTLEATLNALPDAVFVFAPDSTLTSLNPPARKILTAKGCEAATRFDEIPLPREHQEAIQNALTGVGFPAREFDFSRTLNVVLDGRPRRFMLTAIPVPEFANGHCGAIAVLDDVTDFARLDELKSELIGMASHELNSPLTTLRMNLLMLGEQASQLSSRQQQLLSAAVKGCEELGLTIEELLDVTRIESGQLRLNFALIDLAAVLATVENVMQPRFQDVGVKLVIERDAAARHVWGDHARLSSVLANVLGNALKYSPSAGVVIVYLSSGQNPQVSGGSTMQIAVIDQGPGIPDEFRERVFEKFFRVEHHAGQRGKGVRGTGIGLYLCREIVKAHGGRIWCETGDGDYGTRIAISLPVSQ